MSYSILNEHGILYSFKPSQDEKSEYGLKEYDYKTACIYDGRFTEVSQKVWVEGNRLKALELVNYWNYKAHTQGDAKHLYNYYLI